MKLKRDAIAGLSEKGSPHRPASNYELELDRHCKPFVWPAFVLMLLVWLPYILLDLVLHPESPGVILWRLGLSAAVCLAMILYLLNVFRLKYYYFIFLTMFYLQAASAIIIGQVAGDPVYMGGLALVILILPIAPLRRNHGLIILGVSCAAFFLVGWRHGMIFQNALQLYGFLNWIAAIVLGVVSVIALDVVRRESYNNHWALQEIHEDLQASAIQVQAINEELEKTSIQLSAKNNELERAYEELAAKKEELEFINLELENKNSELQRANKIKQELLNMAAHDLKDPLQVIHLYSDAIRVMLHGEKPAIMEKLDRIDKSALKMQTLISGTLEAAVVHRGELQLQKTRQEAAAIVRLAVGNNLPNAERKKQKINLTIHDQCVMAVDKVRLEQILDNLIGNAVKFSSPGKSIDVEMAVRGQNLLLTVRDYGPGVTEEDRKRMFRPFQRLSARPTGGEPSTGLGLSITAELVRLHGGAIHVASEPGRGAAFIVELPIL